MKPREFSKESVLRFLEQNPNHEGKQDILDEIELMGSIPSETYLRGNESPEETLRVIKSNAANVRALISSREKILKLINNH